MVKWECRTRQITYDKKKHNWVVERAEEPPLVGLQAIVDARGTRAWELVTLEPGVSAEAGSFTWHFCTFERQGNRADLALAEDGEKAYFVFLVSALGERDALYEQLFPPAVKARRALLRGAQLTLHRLPSPLIRIQ